MRNLKSILKVFAGTLALTTLVACEEVDPPTPPSKPVASPVVTPKPVETPIAKVVEPPKPVVAPVKRVEPEEEEVDEDDKPKQIIAKARDAIQAGALDKALRLAKIAVEKAPNRSAAWNTLGRVQLQMGKRKEAIVSFEKAVELNPKSSYAQNNFGLALIYDKRYEDAIDALEEATDLETPRAEVAYMWNNLGMAYEHMDRLEEARDAYRKAVELKNERATESLARLEGVKSVFRSAKADLPMIDDDHAGPVPMPMDGGTR
jgi:tetratricopeptide (TPR) repeat protein